MTGRQVLTNPMDRGELWSFLRSCLSQGGDIWLDHKETSYEQYSARLDAAARERVPKLMQLLGDEITQLRGNLSLAEEGLANYALEVERLRAALAPFAVKGETSIQDTYNSRKALGLDPYDDAGALSMKATAPEWKGYCQCKWDKTSSRVIEVHPACRIHAHAHEPCEQRTLCGAKCTFLYSCDLAPGHVGQHADRRSGKWIEWDDSGTTTPA